MQQEEGYCQLLQDRYPHAKAAAYWSSHSYVVACEQVIGCGQTFCPRPKPQGLISPEGCMLGTSVASSTKVPGLHAPMGLHGASSTLRHIPFWQHKYMLTCSTIHIMNHIFLTVRGSPRSATLSNTLAAGAGPIFSLSNRYSPYIPLYTLFKKIPLLTVG